jgi:hypothetical protein
MENGTSSFIEQVQGELRELGSTPTLSVNEQDVVTDFQEQQFSAQRCAQRIADERSAS